MRAGRTRTGPSIQVCCELHAAGRARVAFRARRAAAGRYPSPHSAKNRGSGGTVVAKTGAMGLCGDNRSSERLPFHKAGPRNRVLGSKTASGSSKTASWGRTRGPTRLSGRWETRGPPRLGPAGAAAVDGAARPATLSDEAPVGQHLHHVARALAADGQLAGEQRSTRVPERRRRALRGRGRSAGRSRGPRRPRVSHQRALHAPDRDPADDRRPRGGGRPSSRRLRGRGRRRGRASRRRRRTATSDRHERDGCTQPGDDGTRTHGEYEPTPAAPTRQGAAQRPYRPPDWRQPG
jgi:hypothetical protein